MAEIIHPGYVGHPTFESLAEARGTRRLSDFLPFFLSYGLTDEDISSVIYCLVALFETTSDTWEPKQCFAFFELAYSQYSDGRLPSRFDSFEFVLVTTGYGLHCWAELKKSGIRIILDPTGLDIVDDNTSSGKYMPYFGDAEYAPGVLAGYYRLPRRELHLTTDDLIEVEGF